MNVNGHFLLLLPIMIFCHIVDDYYLQGILAKMKQKKWWEEQTKSMDEDHQVLYKNDWIPSLVCHAFSWSFMIMLPLLVFYWDKMDMYHAILYLIYLIGNAFIHGMIDHAKANKLLINLITDQACHLIQMTVTWFMWHCLI